MEPQPIDVAARAARRRHRYPPDAVCIGCGETDPTTYLFERHHPAGQANEPELTAPPMCANCHRRETARLQDLGVSMDPPPTVLHRIASALGGIGSFLVLLGETLLGYAQALSAIIAALDVHWPPWRNLLAVIP
jgi:hypothetical protein